MKKTIMIMIVLAGSLASCKKNHVCDCDITMTEPTIGIQSQTIVSATFNDSKKGAKQQCADMEISATQALTNIGYTYTGGCELR